MKCSAISGKRLEVGLDPHSSSAIAEESLARIIVEGKILFQQSWVRLDDFTQIFAGL
jgi:hypothetical protein